MLCASTIAFGARGERFKDSVGSEKPSRKKRTLADYFNLNTRADGIESEVVEVAQSSEVDGDLSPAAPELPNEDSALPLSVMSDENDIEATEQGVVEVGDVQDISINEDDVELPGEPTIHRKMRTPVDTDSGEQLHGGGIDVNVKKEAAINLVHRADEYFNEHPIEDSFNKFSHTKEFVNAELYVFAYTQEGVCFAHPHMTEILWKNLYNEKDSYGRYPVRGMINKANQGGGWVTYEWEGATKLSYVKEVIKDNKKYILGAGFYSHSKHDSVINLVKSAVVFFESIIKRGFSPTIAFSAFSYPTGNFVHGDLYTYTIGFDGTTYAHGDNTGLIGTQAINVQDAKGKFINKEIIAALKKSNNGIWIDYISKRAQKKVYAEKVKDKEGNKYFIACGYYPDANREEAVDLVRKAYNYMKANGKSIAAREFTDIKNNDFRYGDLYIFAYDINGKCIAQGNNPALVGKDRIDLQDADGRYYVREFIAKAKQGGGWVNYKVNKLYRSVYVELIDMGVEQFVIGSGLYPVSKRETMVLMVKSAASYLESTQTSEALREFVKQDTKFKRGDLSVFVLQDDGICLAYGDEYDLIWRNLIKVKDDDENFFIRQIIDTAKHGPGLVKYKLNNSPKLSYIEPVHKDGKNYIIGSGYYL